MIDNLLPEGFKDEVSNQAGVEHKYTNKIINLFQKNGYLLVKTPLIEFLNQTNSNNSFKINVKKHHKELVVREDITMQIARLASSRLLKKTRPLKLCYFGEVIRDKGSILRPERQFLQVGAECIGEKSYLADIEMISLAYNALKSVGIKNISIELSSRVFLDNLYKEIKSKNIKKIKSLIKKKDLNNVIKLTNLKHHKYIKDIFSCTGNFETKKNNLKKLKTNNINISEINKIIKIYNNIKKENKKINFFLDLTEIDDKKYHNSVSFTIFAENVRGEIARGGRYITKNSKFKENATGFTCYMDTILRSSSKVEKNKNILIPFNTSAQLKKKLLKDNFIIETYFGNLKKLKNATINKNYKYYLLNNKVKMINS